MLEGVAQTVHLGGHGLPSLSCCSLDLIELGDGQLGLVAKFSDLVVVQVMCLLLDFFGTFLQRVHLGVQFVQLDLHGSDIGFTVHHGGFLGGLAGLFAQMFKGFLGVLNDFFCIAQRDIGFSLHLFLQALELLGFAADKLASLFLDDASEVLGGALDLIFVHDAFLVVRGMDCLCLPL